MEELRQDRADLARGEAPEEHAADEGVDLGGPPLVAGQDRGREAAVAGTGDLEVGDGAPGGDELADGDAIAVAAAAIGADVAAGLEVVDEFLMHAILEEQLDGAEGLLGDVAPEGGGVLDLPPQIGYGKVGQWSHTGHGCILLSDLVGAELRTGDTPSLFRALPFTQSTVHYRAPPSILRTMPRFARMQEGPLAQRAERRAFNPGVGGSSPSRPTKSRLSAKRQTLSGLRLPVPQNWASGRPRCPSRERLYARKGLSYQREVSW